MQKWRGMVKINVVNQMQGIHLNITSYQSNIASNLLKMIATQALNDKAYVNRLKRHYKLFRTKIDDRIREGV